MKTEQSVEKKEEVREQSRSAAAVNVQIASGLRAGCPAGFTRGRDGACFKPGMEHFTLG